MALDRSEPTQYCFAKSCKCTPFRAISDETYFRKQIKEMKLEEKRTRWIIDQEIGMEIELTSMSNRSNVQN
jgi:hypothetical protein